ncbi:MAG: class I SAM-dependent methyltransferase [Firmicutes bacterium]|nr:class I SAM-dependent methyltransferase [Bacillota bacterium]
MKDHQDAFGYLLADWYETRGGEHVVERIDGFVEPMCSCKEYFSPYEDWDDSTKTAIMYAKGRVLDVGTGAGRFALYLQEKGLDVVGIDNSPVAVDLCKKRGLKDARVVPFFQVSNKLGIFDTVIMMGNNFGLFESMDGVRKGLALLDGITTPGAKIIAQTRDIYSTKTPEHLEYHEFNRKKKRMPGQLRLRIRFRKFMTPWFDYLMLSPGEMEQAVADTGWKIESLIYGSYGNYYVILVKA